MSTQAVLNWLNDRLDESLAASPGLPRNAACGLLFNLGFTPANTTVLTYRPLDALSVKSRAAIIINDPESDGGQTHGNGAYGTTQESHRLEIEIQYEADFVGIPETTLPVFTDEQSSQEFFRSFVDVVKRVLRNATYRLDAGGVSIGKNWPLTDATLNLNSKIVAQRPNVRTIKDDAERGENTIDRFYRAFLICEITEQFNDATGG